MEFVLANIFGIDSAIVVVVAVVVLFGGSQIPKFARGLGQAKNEFEKAQKGEKNADGLTPAEEAARAAEAAKTGEPPVNPS